MMKKKKIVLVGGGSGGHITPLFAIASELKTQDTAVSITYITEIGGKFNYLFDSNEDNVIKIFAGKFRRYHSVGVIKQLIDFKTIFLNIIDIFKLLLGIVQTTGYLIVNRPDVIFLKGGFVSLPAGIVARLLRIKYITHDSDASISLTSKLVGKSAVVNLHGLFADNDESAVGIPVGSDFGLVSLDEQKALKKSLGIPPSSRLLLVVGGSIGAKRLNQAFTKAANDILESDDNIYIIHQVGQQQTGFEKINNERYKTIEFIDNMSRYSGASDLIISRAGATAIAEFASQKKPIILVPNPNLTGGHQLQNASLLAKEKACVVVDESPDLTEDLKQKVIELLNDDAKLRLISDNIGKFSCKDSAKKIAGIILEISNVQKK